MLKHTPMVSDDFLQAYQAARYRCAFVSRTDRGWLVLSGKDRASYLQGLLTNDTVALRGGDGCYAAYLTPQGRMIADLWVYELGDVILLSMSIDVRDTVLAKLDQFIFSEDVQLGDVTPTFTGVSVVGPEAPSVVARIVSQVASSALAHGQAGDASPAAAADPGLDRGPFQPLPEHGNRRVWFEGQPAIAIRTSDRGVAGYELLVEASLGATLRAALIRAGAVEMDAAVAETLRIEGGVPVFHRDMDEETIPLEAGIEGRAISLTKGCYVGQEVIIRVLHRGHGRVARRLVGLVLDDGDAAQAQAETPAIGAVIQVEARAIGAVTSAAWSPLLGRSIAMGYVHRDFTTPGTRVTVADRPAAVTALPFHQ